MIYNIRSARPAVSTFLIAPLVAAVIACTGCTGQDQPAAARQHIADRVFLNGAIYTVDDQRSWAEALAIADGEIVYVGSNDGVKTFISDATSVINLEQKMLLPGFGDAHAHVLAGGATELSCDLQDLREHAAIRAALQHCAETRVVGTDEWVVGARWALAAFTDGRPPIGWLDEIFAGRPAYFVDAFSHSAWVSTRALEIAGIDQATPDPKDGVIERDATTGQAVGTLRDSAMQLVSDHIPPKTVADRTAALAAGLRRVSEFGITAFTEPGLNEAQVSTYLQADRGGALSARVLASLSPLAWDAGSFGDEIYDLVARRDAFRGNYFSADSVKVYIDGVIETKTSYMLEPYAGGDDNFPPFYQQDALNSLYQKLDAIGVQVHTHAIGDGAIRVALDAYQHALKLNGPSDNRHQITHLQLIDASDIPRFAELNVAATFQSLWAYPDDYIDVAVDLVGEQRVNAFYPIARVHRSGGLIVGASDWDVSSLNPLEAIEVAVTRQDPWSNSGPVLNQSERVDLATMLAAYTRNAAYVMRLDELVGTLEVGKRADLVVLDRNLFEIPSYEISDADVLLTLMDGREVYRSPKLQ